jgi:hypothetical protein
MLFPVPELAPLMLLLAVTEYEKVVPETPLGFVMLMDEVAPEQIV